MLPALEIRLIAYSLAALLLFGSVAWGVHTLDAHHYERLAAANKHAQDIALQASQDKAIADLKSQQAATQVAEKQYADLKNASDNLSTRLADSVRSYTELHRGLLSATSTAAALADATRQGAERDSQLAGLVRQAVSACGDDAAELTALQTWARQISLP